jgi:hypothetical protein
MRRGTFSKIRLGPTSFWSDWLIWGSLRPPASGRAAGSFMSPVLSAFPGRPLKVSEQSIRAAARGTVALFLVAFVLLLIAFIRGYLHVRQFALRNDLAEHGIETSAVRLVGREQCHSVSRGGRSCGATVRFRLRGSAVEQEVWIESQHGDLILSPLLIVYDPADPRRALPKRELDRWPQGKLYFSLFLIGALLTAGMLLFGCLNLARWWRRRRLVGRPILIPLTELRRSKKAVIISYRHPQTGQSKKQYYPSRAGPLMVAGTAPDSMLLVALQGEDGTLLLLDEELKDLDLSPAERRTVIDAARAGHAGQ